MNSAEQIKLITKLCKGDTVFLNNTVKVWSLCRKLNNFPVKIHRITHGYLPIYFEWPVHIIAIFPDNDISSTLSSSIGKYGNWLERIIREAY